MKNNGKNLELNKIYQGSALSVLKTLPDESLDMCLTSPPYWGLRDYGTEGQIWGGDDKCKHEFDSSKRKLHSGSWGKDDNVLPHYKNATELNWEVEDSTCNKCGAWKGELGLEPSPDLFVSHLCDIFDEVKRCLKPEGTCWVNLGDTYANTGYGKGTGNMQNKNVKGAMIPKVKCDLPQKCLVQIPSRFAIEMTNRGWILRNEIIWHKPSCLPSPAKDRYTVDFEKMFFFTKKKKYYFKQQLEPLKTPYEILKKDKRGKGWKGKEYNKMVNSPDKHGGNKTMGETMNPDGRNKRTVWKQDVPDVPYAVQPRKKEYIYFRELPKHDEIREYLNHWRNEECFTIDEIENHFGNSKGHHWFEKDGSYPSVDDWWTLKDLLKFDEEYDGVMTTEYEKSSEKTTTRPNARNKRTVWSVSTAKFEGAHFAVYPPELIESPIDAGCPVDGTVLDPFFGSGTTAEVAMKQDKNWVGIELNDDYKKISDKRLKPTIVEKKTREKASEFWG